MPMARKAGGDGLPGAPETTTTNSDDIVDHLKLRQATQIQLVQPSEMMANGRQV
jgi:hypothetical protein